MSSYSTRKLYAKAALGMLVLSVLVLRPLKLFSCSWASCSLIGRDATRYLRLDTQCHWGADVLVTRTNYRFQVYVQFSNKFDAGPAQGDRQARQ